MNDELIKKWDRAFANLGEAVLIGRDVACDMCGDDWTERRNSGGFLFQSKAVCPECAPQMEANVTKYREERYIRGRCPADMAFSDWIRERRGPNAVIKVSR